QPSDTEPLDKKSVGRSGVFFRPSIIAGDGYRLHAQVSFEKIDGQYELPNLETLAKRYPRSPQACTAKLRVWPKASLRPRIAYGSNTNHSDAMRPFYVASHVHLVHELGAAASYTPTQLINSGDPADLDVYQTIVTDRSLQDCNKDKARLSAVSDDWCYPWWDR